MWLKVKAFYLVSICRQKPHLSHQTKLKAYSVKHDVHMGPALLPLVWHQLSINLLFPTYFTYIRYTTCGNGLCFSYNESVNFQILPRGSDSNARREDNCIDTAANKYVYICRKSSNYSILAWNIYACVDYRTVLHKIVITVTVWKNNHATCSLSRRRYKFTDWMSKNSLFDIY